MFISGNQIINLKFNSKEVGKHWGETNQTQRRQMFTTA